MPWNRNDPPDPIEVKRRQLAEQERLLSEKMSQLHEELHQSGEPPSSKPGEPPVWRLEEESVIRPLPEPAATRKGTLARQRQRDMVLFFIFIALLLIVLGFVIWAHYSATAQANPA